MPNVVSLMGRRPWASSTEGKRSSDTVVERRVRRWRRRRAIEQAIETHGRAIAVGAGLTALEFVALTSGSVVLMAASNVALLVVLVRLVWTRRG